MQPDGAARRSWWWRVGVPVVAAVAGLLFATSGLAAQGRDLRADSARLPDLIREQSKDNASASSQLQQLHAEVDRLTEAGSPASTEVADLERRADALAPAAGRTSVAGPALTVTLTDSAIDADKLPTGFDVNDIVVHQQDVQAVVNALWAGGAEAMMIQDQRVISTSAIRCVGNTLILQGRVYSPPYRIQAIGNVDMLRSSLDQTPGVQTYLEYVDAVGLGWDVKESREATFPAYDGSISPVVAKADR